MKYRMRLLLIYVALTVVCGDEYYEQRQGYYDSTFLGNLERLVSNDELKCIPRLICERAAGGEPGQLRALQVDTSSLFTLLQYMGLETGGSPMLEIGRAVMTGLSNRGDPYNCYRQYPSCPRDQKRLLHYLNNHRGGFFRGFGRPYYGRQENDFTPLHNDGQSRIVNNAQNFNAIESVADVFFSPGKGFFSENNQFPQSYSNADFILPVRQGKKFQFQELQPSDRLPTKFNFPIRDEDVASFYRRQQNFFPAT